MENGKKINIMDKGTYTWGNGNKYSGEHKDGLADGYGTFTWEDGQKYVGEWKEDQYHGQGIFYFRAWLRSDQGIYKNDELVVD